MAKTVHSTHPFEPGQLVVCVDNTPRHRTSIAHVLKIGGIYRIADCIACPVNIGIVGVTLVGVDPSPNDGWHCFRFKYVERATEDFDALIEELRPRPVLADQSDGPAQSSQF